MNTVMMDHNSRTHIIIKEGRVYAHAIVLNGSVRKVAIPRSDLRDFRQIEYKGQPYPLRRAVRRLLQAGKSLGITAGARAILKSLKEAS